MKSLNPIKIALLLMSIVSAGCAGTGGQNVVGKVDTGLATIGQTAQTGRTVIEAGKTAATGGVPVSQPGLTTLLTSQLGVTQQQALGGAGAIFQVAKAKMAAQAFNKLAQSIPNMSKMLAAAPQPQTGQPLGGATSVMGSGVETTALLVPAFMQLNLSPNMVEQFISLIIMYVQNTSGQVTATLLQAALTAP